MKIVEIAPPALFDDIQIMLAEIAQGRWYMKCGSAILALATLSFGAPAFAGEKSALDASPPGCITANSSPEEKAAAAAEVMAQMLAPRADMPATPELAPSTFATGFSNFVARNVFGEVWPRCGLSRRDRSLVTLGILMALRADNELRFHFPIAIRNGLTHKELEEVIFQASAYAGFPAAANARTIAQEALPPPTE